jgi:hypothetical protein
MPADDPPSTIDVTHQMNMFISNPGQYWKHPPMESLAGQKKVPIEAVCSSLALNHVRSLLGKLGGVGAFAEKAVRYRDRVCGFGNETMNSGRSRSTRTSIFSRQAVSGPHRFVVYNYVIGKRLVGGVPDGAWVMRTGAIETGPATGADENAAGVKHYQLCSLDIAPVFAGVLVQSSKPGAARSLTITPMSGRWHHLKTSVYEHDFPQSKLDYTMEEWSALMDIVNIMATTHVMSGVVAEAAATRRASRSGPSSPGKARPSSSGKSRPSSKDEEDEHALVMNGGCFAEYAVRYMKVATSLAVRRMKSYCAMDLTVPPPPLPDDGAVKRRK